ncbi:MFS transporter [Phycicoccus sp. M110.8]|uniref:MFS transporter n=1 Tax=Phycicoccus sp. M110.8 TaxID=3075433 RepID=UPI0028FDA506|nr:MFS transporter [Phycicoccus sp. M110.8]MDU0312872.1 MFS transporter [Phycicoccus sp. M110.8]
MTGVSSTAGTIDAEPAVPLDTAQGRWIVAATVLGSGVVGIDATVVNIALPAIGRSLGASFASLQWVVTAYALTLAACILVGGSLGDRFGRRRIFLVGVVWFAAASLLCGAAGSAPLLTAGRALQGIGGALLTPGSLAILQSTIAPADRARAIGLWSGLGGVATAAGPFLGGWLVDAVSWHWVFFVNLPVAAVVVAATLRHVPESRDSTAGGHLDVPGAVLGAVALAAASYALIAVGGGGSPALVAVSAAVALVAAAAFVVVERRSDAPMLPFSIFSSRAFSATNLVTFIVYGALSLVFLVLVLQLQVVSGYGPIAAGVSLLPVTGLMLALSARSGALADRIGPRLQLTTGPLVCALGLLLMLRIGPDADYLTTVLPGVVVFGLGLAVLVAPLTATALSSAPAEHAGLASGVNNAVARTGGLLAVAAVPALAGLTGEVYDDPVRFAEGFRTVLLCAVVLLVLGASAAALLSERRRPRPHRRPHAVPSCSVATPPAVVSVASSAGLAPVTPSAEHPMVASPAGHPPLASAAELPAVPAEGDEGPQGDLDEQRQGH